MLEQRRAAGRRRSGRVLGPASLLVFELDTEAVGEPLDRPAKSRFSVSCTNVIDVAALAAAEAVVELVDRR